MGLGNEYGQVREWLGVILTSEASLCSLGECRRCGDLIPYVSDLLCIPCFVWALRAMADHHEAAWEETMALARAAVKRKEQREAEEAANPALIEENARAAAEWVMDPGDDLFRDAHEVHAARPFHPLAGCLADTEGQSWIYCPFCSGRLQATEGA